MGAFDNWQLPTPDGDEAGTPFLTIGTGVHLFDLRGRWADSFGDSGPTEKIGYAVHHAVTGKGDGSLAGDLAILDAIAAYHITTRGWPGIGYHRAIGSGGRVYLLGSSASQRAHVSNLNHKWIGVCFLGTWTNSRPGDDRIDAFKRLIDWETARRGVTMLLAPHKRLEAVGTECPGSWTTVDSWADLVITPGGAPSPVDDPRARARQAITEARAALDRAADALS